MNRFPKDCWHKRCPYFHFWDMSVDDITCVCDKLHKQIDACDEDFVFMVCPLEIDKRIKDGGNDVSGGGPIK